MSIQERAAEQLAEKRRAKKPKPRAGGAWVPAKQYAAQPLKAWQTRDLSMVAKAAFDRLRKVGAIEQPAGVSVSAWFKAWKHAEQARALGRETPEAMAEGVSLTDCTQGNYRDLERHFLGLAAIQRADVFERARRSEPKDEAVRQTLHHLRELLKERGLAESYALKVAAPWFKVAALEDLEPFQIGHLMGRLRKRGHSQK